MNCTRITCFILFMLASACFSCQQNTTSEAAISAHDSVTAHTPSAQPAIKEPSLTAKKDMPDDMEDDSLLIQTQGIVLSVEEELIMPDDYLTTVMKVKTVNHDTIIFADAHGLQGLVGKEVTIQYRLIPQEKLLVCFDCTATEEEVKVPDVTAAASEVQFKRLKLKEYVADPYIDAASVFLMIDEEGQTEEFLSSKNDLIMDSTKMKQSFYSYGIVATFYPELNNREELEQLSD